MDISSDSKSDSDSDDKLSESDEDDVEDYGLESGQSASYSDLQRRIKMLEKKVTEMQKSNQSLKKGKESPL